MKITGEARGTDSYANNYVSKLPNILVYVYDSAFLHNDRLAKDSGTCANIIRRLYHNRFIYLFLL